MNIKTWDLESCESLVITDSGMVDGWMVVFLYMMVTDENILNVNILNSLTHLTSCHFQCFFIVTHFSLLSLGHAGFEEKNGFQAKGGVDSYRKVS